MRRVRLVPLLLVAAASSLPADDATGRFTVSPADVDVHVRAGVSHAGAPDGLPSTDHACGSCHVREAELVTASPLGAGFAKHRGYMEEVGEKGCADCHEALEPASRLPADALRNPCVACHGSRSVTAATIAHFAPPAEAACTVCHASATGSAGRADPQLHEFRARAERLASDLLNEGRSRGIEGMLLYDWLLDRALVLPQHAFANDGLPAAPSFAALLARLRVGRSHRKVETTTGAAHEPIVQCTTCHVAETMLNGMPTTWATTLDLRNQLEELTRRSAEAMALLLAARRAGVETPDGFQKLEEALRARAQSGFLLHTFRRDPGSPFANEVVAGIEHADAARKAGASALVQARRRRLWLLVALVTVGCAGLVVVLKLRAATRIQRRDSFTQEA